MCCLASRIEMSKDALPEKACQLDSRYWRITNAKGDVEEVQGPGVVGKQKITFINLMVNVLVFSSISFITCMLAILYGDVVVV